MYRIQGTITLIAPMLFNGPSSKIITEVDDGSGTGKPKTKKDRIDEAMGKLHRAPDGRICVPAAQFKRVILDGAWKANLKEGKRALGPYLAATVFVDGPLCFDQTEPDEIDEQWGRIPPRTGSLALIRRPLMKVGHTLDFTLNVFDDARHPEPIRAAVATAGVLAGMGSWRPEYGRFRITEWAIESQAESVPSLNGHELRRATKKRPTKPPKRPY